MNAKNQWFPVQPAKVGEPHDDAYIIVLIRKIQPALCGSSEADRLTRGHILHRDEIKGWTGGGNATRRDTASDVVIVI